MNIQSTLIALGIPAALFFTLLYWPQITGRFKRKKVNHYPSATIKRIDDTEDFYHEN